MVSRRMTPARKARRRAKKQAQRALLRERGMAEQTALRLIDKIEGSAPNMMTMAGTLREQALKTFQDTAIPRRERGILQNRLNTQAESIDNQIQRARNDTTLERMYRVFSEPARKPGVRLIEVRAKPNLFGTKPSLTDYIAALKDMTYGLRGRFSIQAMFDHDGAKLWRTYAKTNVDALKKILEDPSIEFRSAFGYEGSDVGADELDELSLDTSVFRIIEYVPSGGCSTKHSKRVNLPLGGKALSPASTNNNCLIECYRHSHITRTGERAPTSAQIRKLLKFQPKTMLTIAAIEPLDKYFNMNTRVNDQFGGCLRYQANPTQILICQDQHFLLQTAENTASSTPHFPKTDIKPDLRQKGNKDKPIVTWYYDLETYYDHDSDLHAYSAALINSNGFQWFHIGKDTMSELITQLRINSTPNERNILVGYNNSRFDDYMLLGELINQEYIGAHGVQLSGNSILKARFLQRFETLDLCRFVMSSLASACQAFRCELSKLSLDHNEVQKHYFDSPDGTEFWQWLDSRRNEIFEYNLRDVTALQELHSKVEAAFKQLAGMSINDSLTISNFAYKHWKTTAGAELVCNPKTKEEYKFIRDSIVAGRSEIFQQGTLNEEVASADVKSLYPYVMKVGQYPIGESIATDHYVPNKCGVYEVKIISQPKLNITPFRRYGAPLNWKSQHSFTCKMTSVDIQTHLDFGSQLEIGRGYYWEESSDAVFQDFIYKYESEKSHQDQLASAKSSEYNPALRNCCKLALNGLSGKMCQRRFKSEVILSRDEKTTSEFVSSHTNIEFNLLNRKCYTVMLRGDKKKEYKDKNVKSIHLGVFIYSWARRHMYLAALSRISERIATDTDSVHLPLRLLDQYVQTVPANSNPKEWFGKFVMGDQFGMIENEIDFKNRGGVYLIPKCYAIVSSDPARRSKYRFKGVRPGRDKWISRNSYKAFQLLPLDEQFEAFQRLPCAICDELYYHLARYRKAYLVSSNIGKTVLGTPQSAGRGFAMNQSFMVKKVVIADKKDFSPLQPILF